MKKITDVSEIVVEGAHWHAQPAQVPLTMVAPSIADLRNADLRNAGPRVGYFPVLGALPVMPLGVAKARAKQTPATQAPLSRECLAHT